VNVTGLATGTAVITATLTGGSTASAIVYVGGSSAPPAVYNNISVNGTPLQVGAATYGLVSLSSAATQDAQVTLSTSANGIVTLPQTTLTIAAGQSQLYFPIVAAAAGTVDVSATIDGTKKSYTVTVVAMPTFNLSVNSTLKVGDVVEGVVSSNCVLAQNVSFDLASSMSGIGKVSPAKLTLGPGTLGASAQFSLTGVAAGMTTITAMSTGVPTLMQTVTVTP
jgi:hypothetical protein